MEFVTNTNKKVMAGIKLTIFFLVNNIAFSQFFEGTDEEVSLSDPENGLIISEFTDPYFDIRFLEKGGVVKFMATHVLVFEAAFNKFFLGFTEEEILVRRIEETEQFEGVPDEAGFQLGAERAEGYLSFFEGLFDGTIGVTDFEFQVPKDVENFLVKYFQKGLENFGADFLGIEKHHINVAEGGKFTATITS